MSIAAQVKEVLATKGEATVDEISEAIGDDGSKRKNIGQALAQNDWAVRIGRGRYVYQNGSKPKMARPSTPAELQPLIDTLSDEEFDQIGLDYVARTQDGGFICVDRNGAAWLVEVTATAKLI